MFKTVQQCISEPSKKQKKEVIPGWHTVRKEAGVLNEMKFKFTYKELTLILGILVAVIIMITLWLSPAVPEANEAVKNPVPSIAKPAASILLQETYIIINKSLQ